MNQSAATYSSPSGFSIKDVALLFRKPSSELSIWKDLLQTNWAVKPLLTTYAENKTLLLPLLGDWVYSLKQHLALALPLRARGYRTVVLLESSRARKVVRYAKAFGVSNFINLDNFELEDEEARRCESHVTHLGSLPARVSEIKEWTFMGAWIGPHLLSSVSRHLQHGVSGELTPETRSELFRLLPSVLRTVLIARKVLSTVEPDLMLVNEANYYVFGPLVDAAVQKGVDVIQFTQPWEEDRLVFKRLTLSSRRTHPCSVSERSLKWAEEKPWGSQQERAVDELLKKRFGPSSGAIQKRNQPVHTTASMPSLSFGVTKPLGVIFSHVLWDSNFFYGRDLFEDYSDWLVQTVRAAANNREMNWLIKLHPANAWKKAYSGEKKKYSELGLIAQIYDPANLPPNLKLIMPEDPVSTLELIMLSKVGVTVRGTAGIEMACHGKTVLTAGSGRYSGLGFTIDPETPQEYLDLIRQAHTLPTPTPLQTTKARKYAYLLFALRPWKMTSFQNSISCDPTRPKPLDHNLSIEITASSELTDNPDLSKWSGWAAGSSDEDFLDRSAWTSVSPE